MGYQDAVVPMFKDNEGYYVYDNAWENPGVPAFKSKENFLGATMYGPSLDSIYKGLGVPPSSWPQPSLNEFNVHELNDNESRRV
jgi:hypothetical protein